MYTEFIVARFSFRSYDELYIYGKYLFPALIISDCILHRVIRGVIYQSLSKSYHICSKREDPYRLLSTTKCNRLFIESTLVHYLDIVFTDENVVEMFDIEEYRELFHPQLPSIDRYIFNTFVINWKSIVMIFSPRILLVYSFSNNTLILKKEKIVSWKIVFIYICIDLYASIINRTIQTRFLTKF